MADLGLSPPIGLSTNLLIDVFSARSAQNFARNYKPGPQSNSAVPDTSVPPPWDPDSKPPGLEKTLNTVLSRGIFFENNLGAFSNSAAPADQKKLFALYSGVNKLAALATDASNRTTSDARRSFLNKNFDKGITQLGSFLSATKFQDLSFLQGEKLTSARSTLAIGRGNSEFVTGVIQDGPFDAPVASLAGNVQFDITAKKLNGNVVVNIDLAGMGTTPRTMDNVAAFINTKLVAAGLVTTVKREKIGIPDKNGIIPGNQFGLKFTGVSSEPLSFSTPASTPSLYTVGTSGFGKNLAVQLVRYDSQAGGAPTVAFSKRLGTTEGTPNKALAVKTGANGEVYVLSQSTGTTGGLTPRGTQDVFLTKYDSTGKEVFTRGIGAADTASGLALAVAADGSVVVAGKVTGTLGTTTNFGGADAFATKFDATGREVFVKRFGGSGSDDVRSIALGSNGNIYLAGRTTSPLSGAQGGGDDGYVRALSATGATLYTRQFGGAGNETANAVTVDANGDLLVASVESGIGKLRKYSALDGVSTAIYTHDLGALDGGTISSITLDGTGIIVAGSAGAANALGTAVTAHAGGRDGFVARIDENGLGQPVRTYTTFLGTSGEDRVNDVVAYGGNLYLAGSTTGSLPGGGVLAGTENAYSAVLNAASGAQTGSVQVSGRGGFSSAAAIAVDPKGVSILDALGLPRGDVLYTDSRLLTDRSLARPGDSFLLSVDGGAKRKVRISATDNYRTLTQKINAITILNGKARVVRGTDGDTLKITTSKGHSIELFAGPKGRDLLKALGLPEGVVQPSKVIVSNNVTASTAPPSYGLALGSGLNLSTLKGAKAASDILQQALTTIRSAYRTLTLDPALKDLLNGKGKGTGGPVPAYLTRQIANYSAGLSRLQSSGGGGGFLA